MIGERSLFRDGADNHYPLVIVGGGIFGAALAWEAAHRGIRVLLVEAGDFGAATSANSFKVIHGGVRYLQQFDLARVRRSSLERRALFRIAPHLVSPLECSLPTVRSLTGGRLALSAGMALYNLLSADRNSGVSADHTLPAAGICRKSPGKHELPPLAESGITGRACWYDGQAWHTERLVMALLRSAYEAGAQVCNYSEALDIDVSGGRIRGVALRDRLGGGLAHVGADALIDCSSGKQFIGRLAGAPAVQVSYIKAVNIIVKGLTVSHCTGVRSQMDGTAGRLLFLCPWRDVTMLGTWYLPCDGADTTVSPDDITGFVHEINSAFREPLIDRADIVDCHIGSLPLSGLKRTGSVDTQLMNHTQWVNLSEHGIQGAFILRGTKYTMARHAAEGAIDRLARIMQWSIERSRSSVLPLEGGNILDMEDRIKALIDGAEVSLAYEVARELLAHFGDNSERVLALSRAAGAAYQIIPDTSMPTGAIDYVFEREWVTSLSDLFRRLELRKAGTHQPRAVHYCLQRLAVLKGWGDIEQRAQYQAFSETLWGAQRIDEVGHRPVV